VSILLIGAGRMGSALLKGWLNSGVKAITVVEPKPSAELKKLAKSKKIALVAAPSQVKTKPSVCLVAIKPQVLKGEAGALANFAQGGALMISIAAGTSVAALTKAWGKTARIIRAMPNTPGAIGAGISGLYAAKGATAADKKRAASLLSALGQTEWVAKEGLIDSVTAVSGSGPAYLFLMVEALAEAGIAEGLPRAQAEKFARATVAGAGALLAADKSPASALREAVTSPGGTTAAALGVLMANDGLTALMKRAVSAARKRAEELR
jgi:pyrroline-5-carboxylate reductase